MGKENDRAKTLYGMEFDQDWSIVYRIFLISILIPGLLNACSLLSISNYTNPERIECQSVVILKRKWLAYL